MNLFKQEMFSSILVPISRISTKCTYAILYSTLRNSFCTKQVRYYVTTNNELRDWTAIPSPTPFDNFALPKNASEEEIKSRYYELVKIHHPDISGDKSQVALERFRKLV